MKTRVVGDWSGCKGSSFSLAVISSHVFPKSAMSLATFFFLVIRFLAMIAPPECCLWLGSASVVRHQAGPFVTIYAVVSGSYGTRAISVFRHLSRDTGR